MDTDLAAHALDQLDIDARGFDRMDRRYLESLVIKFGGGPVGIDTIAASMGESGHTIEDVLEPYMIQEGFVQRTPRGRVATPRAFAHMDVVPTGSATLPGLFEDPER